MTWEELLGQIGSLLEQDASGAACADLRLGREGDRLVRAELAASSVGDLLASLGLVRQAQGYAAAVPGPLTTAGPALLEALRLVLDEDRRTTGGGTAYRIVGGSRGRRDPVLVVPGGPLLDGHYLGDLGGLADRRPLAVAELPRRRVEELVPVLDEIRSDLGLERVDLLAHSAGAAAALCYLAEHPDRVGTLVLLCPAIRAAGVPDDPEGVRRVIERRTADPEYAESLQHSDQDPGSLLAQRIYFGTWSQEHAGLAVTTLPDREARLAAYHADPRPDPGRIRQAAAGFQGRVLVLHGEDDLHPTVRQARELAALFPRGETVLLPGAAHYPWLDAPQPVVGTICTALQEQHEGQHEGQHD